jgi:murein L,D-transpeptidase YafK
MEPLLRSQPSFWLAALVIGLGCMPSDVSAKSGDRVERAAASAHARLDAKLAAKSLAFGDELFVRIFKEERQLETWLRKDDRFVLLKTYEICEMSGELGPKERLGDEQAPEGFYFVPPNMMNDKSRFHLSFNLGYPNAYDRAHERTGSALMVHGDCVSIGCFAMTDEGIEEIYTLADAALDNGQPFFRVHVFPFRMTKKNMKRHGASKWKSFWTNLKQGYDHFESKRVPPKVSVSDGKYVFSEDRGAE